MSLPRHNPDELQKGYGPTGERPGITDLALRQAAQAKYPVVQSGGGSYIDGIPPLRWGQWRDTTFHGAEKIICDVLGLGVSYEALMGWSAACFHLAAAHEDFAYGVWDPSATMMQIGQSEELNASRACGIDVYRIGEAQARDACVMHSLDNGIPVLACGQRGAPEWTLLTGYEKRADKPVFFGRTYFDEGDIPPDALFTPNGYTLADQYPGESPEALLRFYDRRRHPLSEIEALRASLAMSLTMFAQPRNSAYAFGYDAYRVLIDGFEKDDGTFAQRYLGNALHMTNALLDARRCACVYLGLSGPLLPGRQRERLYQAELLFRSLFGRLADAIPYREYGEPEAELLQWMTVRTNRLAVADALRDAAELERQARGAFRRILDGWDA